MAVGEGEVEAPGNEAIGDLLRHRKRALRAVQATAKLRTRGEALSSWSPRAALYKKRRALRQDLAVSTTGATQRKTGTREGVDQPAASEEDAQPENAAEKQPRGRWFSGLLDSPSAPASSKAVVSSPEASASPKVRRVIHGVLQSPAEVRLSDAAKKARRQLTRMRSMTSDGCETSIDEPVFCGQTAATSRSALFSANLDGDVPDGAIMCADLGNALDDQRNAITSGTNTRTEQEVAADVAASAVSKLFSSAISSAVVSARGKEN